MTFARHAGAPAEVTGTSTAPTVRDLKGPAGQKALRGLVFSYWGGRGRTSNLPGNSRALCQLSYTPSTKNGRDPQGSRPSRTSDLSATRACHRNPVRDWDSRWNSNFAWRSSCLDFRRHVTGRQAHYACASSAFSAATVVSTCSALVAKAAFSASSSSTSTIRSSPFSPRRQGTPR